ncbi:hypothetical protein ACG2K1_04255 [Neisseria sp. 23W00296]|uniref:hypothetical protein n=1 Tax=unclassified Neisseria TaxID=2623750 RepID=UPI000B8C05F5|nr:hypothetical protein [Neisseria sp. KEM232]ASP16833.1 hypothetical protein CGZ77_03195 [Neisseria sp. KEM232]
MLTISLAAVFLVKIHACRVKNARKMSNLAALFSLQARIFPQKTASQAECQHALGKIRKGRLKSTSRFQTAFSTFKPTAAQLVIVSQNKKDTRQQAAGSTGSTTRRSNAVDFLFWFTIFDQHLLKYCCTYQEGRLKAGYAFQTAFCLQMGV